MEIIKIWRGNSKADGEFCRVVQFVNYGRFYELPYDKRKDDFYLSESIPVHRKMKALRGLLRSGFYSCPNPLNNPELVAVFYEGEKTMTKFISVKVFRGTISEDEKNGKFAGQPGACFRVATEDDAHVKCFHVSEPPFDVKDLDNVNNVRHFVFASLVLNPYPDAEVKLLGAELVAEYKITEEESGASKIERIK